ncbi:MAG: galactokinase [Ruminococcaceae bacterium]|nr:galactokinase [Oscillospiraceae bacterium]
MNTKELLTYLKEGGLDARLTALYGADRVAAQRARYYEAVTEFAGLFGEEREVLLFSVPGRSEISGNHTDHNRGCVIAAAVDLDIIAVVAKRDDDTVTVKSKGFPADTVSCFPGEPDESLFYTSSALLSGTCAGFLKRGYRVCGFDAYTTSSVLKGSGISSSAAFEVMIGTILNHLVNEAAVTAPVVAEIAQFAENVYFGKPSGLMDQTACAVGGFSFIDFADPAAAKIEKLDFDLSEAGYSLCITNTGGNHADLNDDYASVPAEMKAVAAAFGQPVLRGLTTAQLFARAGELRETVGDRALLRAFHFLSENERVVALAEALKGGDIDTFFEGIKASGRSSFMWLQNVYTVKNVNEQGLSLALAVTEYALKDTPRKAAWRIHGGGFAGTIQAFVPKESVDAYRASMEAVFGEGACAVLRVRRDGCTRVY